ncbi:hypothetical protein MPTK1_4g01310 [Marchantia polymorpha subsp. ruderalis]|uniref:Uncharacterized protein n=2 Tax=Marchantia polymorpha TaxID=3197 RepID=A0AAF6B550_MARPO|nr:hypothetical protein MARPO_0066s0012 [Marchantia polymorpha]BBN07134.1 hypothetical protein Mp_4g01310 [Marchantia polymorpha subsp. ruderalis]|eukprot:PTQ36050.1 hypothetical protein MARPO_0066s0012 [Marchantia polymorpha]
MRISVLELRRPGPGTAVPLVGYCGAAPTCHLYDIPVHGHISQFSLGRECLTLPDPSAHRFVRSQLQMHLRFEVVWRSGVHGRIESSRSTSSRGVLWKHSFSIELRAIVCEF